MYSDRQKIFFFDSDALIDAKNHYYNPSYAEIFWSWLLDGVNKGLFRTAINVKKELLAGNDGDFLKEIAADNRFDDFWCETETTEIIVEFAKLQNWAANEWAYGKKNRKTEAQLQVALKQFAGSNADPWLVALASHMQSSIGKKTYIVTNENSAPRATVRVMLPDAAKSQGIDVIRVFDLLKQYSGKNFQFNGY